MTTDNVWQHAAGREILLVDAGVDDAEILLAGLRPGLHVERLSATANPVDAIGFALADKRDVKAVHILSHGAPGTLLLGGQHVDAAAVAARPQTVAQIRSVLAEDAEIVLYGCSVAEGDVGTAFVSRLSDLLRCDVVASATPTGAAALGGDWDLPASQGPAFSEAARAEYPGLLIVATFGIVTTINTTTTLTSNESGVTISATKSDGGQLNVSSGFLNPGTTGSGTTYTLTFSTAVNVTQFQMGEFTNLSAGANYTFTPNTGSAVTIADNSGSISGAIATLNPGDWTGITSITVSYAGGTDWRVGLDNINFTLAGPSAPGTPDLIAASDTGTSNTDNITSNATPTVSGSGATAGNAVHVLVGGVTAGTTTADGSGNWTFAFSTTLSAGTNAITAIQDSGTAESTASTALNIVVDTTAPSLAAPDLLAASDTGSSNTDNITNNALTQQIGGSATTGDVVSVMVDGVTVGNVTAVGGSWSYSLSLAAGSYAVTASATDLAGNAGAASGALGLTIDTTAPTALAQPDLLAASDLGSSSTDNITSSLTQQFSGSATTGDTVSILVGGVTANTVVAAGGSWSYTHTLSAGSYAISVLATDAAGNAGQASSTLGIVIDTTAPGTAGAPDLVAASDSGTSNTDNITNVSTPVISGSGAAANSRVQVLVGGVTAGTANTDGGGNWTFAFSTTLASGTHAITVQAEDVAGNTGPASSALNVVIDTAGATLAAPDLTAASDTGVSNTDNITGDGTPTVEGTAEANASVTVLNNGTTVGSTTAGAGGGWSFTFTSTLADGSYAITAVQTDSAGNTSAASSALNITVDTTAPTTLAPPDLLAASDLGISSTDNITSATTQTIGGSTANGDVVSVIVGGTTVGAVTAAGGSWTYALSLSAGSYAVTASVTDAVGNAGPTSTALGIVVDTTAPGTVGTPDLLASSDLGTSSTDNLTADRTPTVSGSGAVANTLVHVLVGGTTAGSVTASAAGAWTFTFTSTLAAGTNAITARTEDVAGNDGPQSVALNVVVDATPPAAPGTLATPDLIASSDDGTSSTDNVTTDTTPTFTGSNTTGSTAHVLVANGVTVGSFTSEAGGTYNVTASSLTAGSYAITIREQDAAGNTSSDSPALGLTISAPSNNGGGNSGGDSGGSSGGSDTSTTANTTTTTSTDAATGTTTESRVVQNTSTGTASAAIVENTNNNGNVVTATLPSATSISSEGPATAQTATEALTTLVNAVDARNSTGEAGLITGAQSFLNRLSATTTLDVRTIIPTTTSTSLSAPIVITGTAATGGATQSEAFVIDVRSLPTGSTLQLDNIEFASIIGSATVNGGGGDNFATGDDSAQFISLGVGDDTLLGGDGADTIGSGTGNDSLDGEGGDDRVFGGEGNDTVIGSGGADVVYGNQQADVLYGNLANDTLFGGQDSDTVFGGQADDLIYGNMAADTLWGQLGADTIFGGQGDDLINGGDANDRLYGNLGNDLLSGGAGDDNLFGGAGDDTLYGGVAGSAAGIDILDGGAGNDALYGGQGVDWIYTGDGSDAIYVEALNGFDVVVDFDAASGDVIHIASDVNGSGLTDFGQVQAAAVDNADGNVEIALGSDNYIRLMGVTSSQLTSDMFQFF